MYIALILIVFSNLICRLFLVRFFSWYYKSTNSSESMFLNSTKFRNILHIPPISIVITMFLCIFGFILTVISNLKNKK